MKKNPHARELRLAWLADPDPVVASAGWALPPGRTSPFAPAWIAEMVRRQSAPPVA